MRIAYEVESYPKAKPVEYDNEQEARAVAIELCKTLGYSNMKKWVVNRNRPGCLPDEVYNVLTMDLYEMRDGVVCIAEPYIHGPEPMTVVFRPIEE